jgi:hypothetical protein
MERLSLATLLGMVFLLAACNQHSLHDRLVAQDFGTTAGDFALDVAANSTGVYVVGDTYGSLHSTNLGQDDVFIRKYDGGVLWAEQFGTRQFDFPNDVAADNAGNNYTFGTTYGALGFKVGLADCFLRKYNTNGVLRWTRQFGTTNGDTAKDMTIDSSGNIYTLSDEVSRVVIRKWNGSGSVLLTITLTGATLLSGDAKALAVDSVGNIYMLAYIFNGANNDVRLYKFTSAGAAVAGFPKNAYASVNNDTPYAMKIDSADNVYFTLINDDGLGTTAAYLRKLTSSGVPVWTRNLEPTAVTGFTAPNALALDASGNVYVGGNTSGAYTGFTNAGFFDIFALKYSSTGTRLWTRQFGAGDDELNQGIAVSDVVYLAGSSYSDPNLLGDPGYGDADAYLAQLDSATGEVLGIDQ